MHLINIFAHVPDFIYRQTLALTFSKEGEPRGQEDTHHTDGSAAQKHQFRIYEFMFMMVFFLFLFF